MVALTKLSIIQRALLNTGNVAPSVEEDGSDEWAVASAAYDEELQVMIEDEPWPFALLEEPATAVGPDTGDYAWKLNRPAGLIHIEQMKAGGKRLLDYELRGAFIYADTATDVTVVGTFMPENEPWSAMFARALRLKVEVAILRGLNEDENEAMQREAVAEQAYRRAKARIQSERPRKAIFISRALNRRIRRG